MTSWSHKPSIPFGESVHQWLQHAKPLPKPSDLDPNIPALDEPSKVDRTKGMADLALSRQGENDVEKLAEALGRRGHLATVMTGHLQRIRETGQVIADATGAMLLDVSPHTEPWHLGEMEGQPVAQTLQDLRHYVENPDDPVPGVSQLSGVPGESYNTFKSRWLGWLRDGPMRGPLSSTTSVLIVTHSHNQKLLQDWVDAGTPADLRTTEENILDEADPPGSVSRLWQPPGGLWAFQEFDPEGAPGSGLPPGIYIVRHGATVWNVQTKAPAAE